MCIKSACGVGWSGMYAFSSRGGIKTSRLLLSFGLLFSIPDSSLKKYKNINWRKRT